MKLLSVSPILYNGEMIPFQLSSFIFNEGALFCSKSMHKMHILHKRHTMLLEIMRLKYLFLSGAHIILFADYEPLV